VTRNFDSARAPIACPCKYALVPARKHKRRRAEVSDPSREEQAGGRSTSRHAAVQADVVDGHEDHHHAADDVDSGDARTSHQVSSWMAA
jgi:hypothetical protein